MRFTVIAISFCGVLFANHVQAQSYACHSTDHCAVSNCSNPCFQSCHFASSCCHAPCHHSSHHSCCHCPHHSCCKTCSGALRAFSGTQGMITVDLKPGGKGRVQIWHQGQWWDSEISLSRESEHYWIFIQPQLPHPAFEWAVSKRALSGCQHLIYHIRGDCKSFVQFANIHCLDSSQGTAQASSSARHASQRPVEKVETQTVQTESSPSIDLKELSLTKFVPSRKRSIYRARFSEQSVVRVIPQPRDLVDDSGVTLAANQ